MTARQIPGQLLLWEPARPIPPTPAPPPPDRRALLPARVRRHFSPLRETPARPATRKPARSYIHGRRIRTLNPPQEYL